MYLASSDGAVADVEEAQALAGQGAHVQHVIHAVDQVGRRDVADRLALVPGDRQQRGDHLVGGVFPVARPFVGAAVGAIAHGQHAVEPGGPPVEQRLRLGVAPAGHQRGVNQPAREDRPLVALQQVPLAVQAQVQIQPGDGFGHQRVLDFAPFVRRQQRMDEVVAQRDGASGAGRHERRPIAGQADRDARNEPGRPLVAPDGRQQRPARHQAMLQGFVQQVHQAAVDHAARDNAPSDPSARTCGRRPASCRSRSARNGRRTARADTPGATRPPRRSRRRSARAIRSGLCA